MANWAYGEMSVVLPTKNIDRFLDYANDDADKHFYRTSFEGMDRREDDAAGLSEITLNVECAWSAESCLINPGCEDYISLKEVCEELNVQSLAVSFEEYGMMLGETIRYDKDAGINYASYKLLDAELTISKQG